MKAYTKPAIEFIELKPEERLACGSGTSGSGCCSGGGGGGGSSFIWFFCEKSFPISCWCSNHKRYQKHSRWC